MRELNVIFILACFTSLYKLSYGQLPPLDRDQFSWITPLRGDISQQCLDASNKYVDQLLSLGQELDLTKLPGALQMFDSNGRLPVEGFLSDTLDFPLDICQNNEYCIQTIPDQLRFISLKIPLGYSINRGDFHECLNSNDVETVYCQMIITGPPELANGAATKSTKEVDKEFPLGNIKSIPEFNEQLKHKINFGQSLSSNSTMYELYDYESLKAYIKKMETYNHVVSMDLQDYILYTAMAVFSTVNTALLGMCFPKECSMDDINKNYANLTAVTYEASGISICDLIDNLPFPGLCNVTLPVMPLVVASTECYSNENIHGTPEKFPSVFLFVYTVFTIIGVLMVAGTVSEMTYIFILKNPLPDNLIMNILHSYSVYSNGKQVLSTKTMGKDHLDCMNGMRFISMTWVVLGHSFFIFFYASTRNTKDISDLYGNGYNMAFEVILNAFPSVDSFFVISGTLTTYIFLKELDRAGNDINRHTVTFIMYFLHRYLRLTITYALIMGIVVAVLPYVYYGPSWSGIIYESEQCRQHWWKHLLYIHTLVKEDIPNQCMDVTWYLVDDMMFHVFSPIVIYPMYLAYKYTKKHLASIGFWFFSLFWFTFGVFYISYTTKIKPGEGIMIEDFVTDYTYHVTFYAAPWTRYQPYLVGIMLGYILHHLRGKSIKIKEEVNIFGWQAAFLSAFAVVYGLWNVQQTHHMTLFAATMYNTFQRIAWSGALAWVIFSCSKGYGGIINEFLSWSAFAPLSRLTFCSYLIHLNIIQMFGIGVLSLFPGDMDIWSTVWYYFAIQFLTCVIAFGLTLAFEMPSVRIEKLVVNAILSTILRSPKNDVAVMKNQNNEVTKITEKHLEDGQEEIQHNSIADDSIGKDMDAEEAREGNASSEQDRSDSAKHSVSDDKSENISNPPAYDQVVKSVDGIQKA